MASKRWPSIALVTTGAVLAGLVAAAAAFVPWLSAPQTPVETFQRDPSTPVVQLRDGRNISYGVYGDPNGKHLCFWFHGTPSCRLEADGLSKKVFKQLSIKVVAFDRPGYGQSDPHPIRTYATFADDLAQMADAFGAPRFFVAGASGGGPYALAATAYLQDRVLATIANCAAGSWGALNETERAELPLTKRQRKIIKAVNHLSKAWWFRRLLAAVYAVPRVQRLVFETGMKGWVNEAATKMTEGDIECFRKPPEYWQNHVRPESIRQQTSVPWIEDHVLFFDDWPFAISAFSEERQARIFLAHGLEDRIVHPVFSSALKRQMPNAHLELIPGAGHVDFWVCDDSGFQQRIFSAMLRAGNAAADS